MVKTPISKETQEYGDGEVSVTTWTFERLTREELEQVLCHYDLGHLSGRPGGFFKNAPEVNNIGNLTIIRQRCGWDI